MPPTAGSERPLCVYLTYKTTKSPSSKPVATPLTWTVFQGSSRVTNSAAAEGGIDVRHVGVGERKVAIVRPPGIGPHRPLRRFVGEVEALSAGDVDMPATRSQLHESEPQAGENRRRTRAYGCPPARRALALTDVTEPRLLELGALHGELSRRLLRTSPTARVTVSDIGEDFVAAMQDSDLARHPRADIRRIDATRIDADDDTWDVAIFAFALHHLPPTLVVDLLRETTRVAHVLLVVDPVRSPLLYAALPPFVIPSQPPALHDGMISARRAYSRSALQAIGDAAGVNVRTKFMFPAFMTVEARRR